MSILISDTLNDMLKRINGVAQAMVKTVLYAEKLYDNDKVEREVFGPDVRVVWRNVSNLSQLEEHDCADVDGLMVLRHGVTAEHFAKFPKLACVVRMGVGYDKIDRKAAAARNEIGRAHV